jgi:hypothetical protein
MDSTGAASSSADGHSFVFRKFCVQYGSNPGGPAGRMTFVSHFSGDSPSVSQAASTVVGTAGIKGSANAAVAAPTVRRNARRDVAVFAMFT